MRFRDQTVQAFGSRFLVLVLLFGIPFPVTPTLLGQSSPALKTEIEGILPIPDSLGLARIRGGWTDGARLILIDSRTSEVWMIDLESGEPRRVGRIGEGPGEYRTPVFSGRLGDSIWVADTQLRRITLFDEGGLHLKTIPPPPTFINGIPLRVRALLRGGRQLLRASNLTTEVIEAGGSDGTLVWYGPEPGEADTIRVLNLENAALIAVAENGATISGTQPFAAVDRIDVDPAGKGVWIVANASEGIQVELVDESGQTASELLIPYTAPPLEDRDIEAWLDDKMEGYSDLRARIAIEPLEVALREAVYRPERWPAFDEVVADPDGAVWLRHPEPTGGWWRRVCADAQEASVRLPEGIGLLIPGGGRLFGVRLGHFDVPEVVELKVDGDLPRCDAAG